LFCFVPFAQIYPFVALTFAITNGRKSNGIEVKCTVSRPTSRVLRTPKFIACGFIFQEISAFDPGQSVIAFGEPKEKKRSNTQTTRTVYFDI